eukprot:scaffold84396_cov59-Phaeocystis_antarctica.AAC.5
MGSVVAFLAALAATLAASAAFCAALAPSQARLAAAASCSASHSGSRSSAAPCGRARLADALPPTSTLPSFAAGASGVLGVDLRPRKLSSLPCCFWLAAPLGFAGARGVAGAADKAGRAGAAGAVGAAGASALLVAAAAVWCSTHACLSDCACSPPGPLYRLYCCPFSVTCVVQTHPSGTSPPFAAVAAAVAVVAARGAAAGAAELASADTAGASSWAASEPAGASSWAASEPGGADGAAALAGWLKSRKSGCGCGGLRFSCLHSVHWKKRYDLVDGRPRRSSSWAIAAAASVRTASPSVYWSGAQSKQ